MPPGNKTLTVVFKQVEAQPNPCPSTSRLAIHRGALPLLPCLYRTSSPHACERSLAISPNPPSCYQTTAAAVLLQYRCCCFCRCRKSGFREHTNALYYISGFRAAASLTHKTNNKTARAPPHPAKPSPAPHLLVGKSPPCCPHRADAEDSEWPTAGSKLIVMLLIIASDCCRRTSNVGQGRLQKKIISRPRL